MPQAQPRLLSLPGRPTLRASALKALPAERILAAAAPAGVVVPTGPANRALLARCRELVKEHRLVPEPGAGAMVYRLPGGNA